MNQLISYWMDKSAYQNDSSGRSDERVEKATLQRKPATEGKGRQIVRTALVSKSKGIKKMGERTKTFLLLVNGAISLSLGESNRHSHNQCRQTFKKHTKYVN